VRLSILTLSLIRPIVPAPAIDDSVDKGGTICCRGKPKLWKGNLPRAALSTTCPTWMARTRASTVRIRRLTTLVYW